MFHKSFFTARSRSRRSGHSSSRKTKTFRPAFEPLEQRMLLSITMAQWSTQDIVYTTTDTSSNWYIDSRQLQVTFTPPSGSGLSPIVVKGFWDGGSAFVARFTPTTTGTWTYSTVGSTITNLTNQTEALGSEIVVGAPVTGQHGFLRVDPVYDTSFVWDDGTRFFMEGQTYYDWLQAANVNDNWKTSVDSMLQYGFTKVRFDVYACNYPGEHNDYPDAQPYTGEEYTPNRDSLNLPYWEKLDEMIQYMDSKGLVADLIVTTPYHSYRQYGTDAQNDRFVNYVVARYAAYPNVTWCLCNEWEAADNGGSYPQVKADFNRMGSLIRNGDPWMSQGAGLRPLSIHNQNISFQYFDVTWPTHVIIQYHPTTPTQDVTGNDGIIHNEGHNMPVVNDEYRYIGVLTRVQNRWGMWSIAVAGGYSSTADFREHPNGMGIPESTGDWTYQPEYGDIKNMVDFFTTEGIEYWKMTSHNELKSGSSRDYLLAEPGRQYVLYTAVGDSAAGIDLTGYSGNFNVFKLDPTSGTMTNLGPVAGGAVRTWNLTGSNSVGDTDWVLLVTKLDVLGAVPAVPSNLAATVISTSRIDLNWTDNSSTETGFEIDRATNSSFTSGLTTFTVGADVTTYQSTGLTYGTTYYYRVRATIGGGNDSADSSTASATAGVFPPASPTGLGATAVSATQINLSWTDNSTNETGFEIDRALDSAFSGGLTITTVGANVTTYQSTALSGSTTYYYRVRATIDSNNDSTNSNTADATTFAPPVQLLYDYGLDGNANNLAGPGPNGTLAGTTLPTFEAGVIGQAMNTGTAGYIDLGTAGYPQAISPYAAGSTDGFWTGTLSFWTNSVSGANVGRNWVTGWNTASSVNTGIYNDWPALGTIGYYAKIGTYNLHIQATAPTVDIEDESWHLITVSYNLTSGASGTGSGEIWIDGVAQTVSYSGNTLVGTEAISTPTSNALGTDLNYNRSYGFNGKLDDVARWCTEFDDSQAKALYNLGFTGIAGTHYNASDATALFNGFSSGTGVVTSDGKSWSFVASGLSGAAGTVGDNYVVLSGSGGGMILTPIDVAWTGGSSSIWSTAPGSGNWKKTSDGTTVDYTDQANVTFDDTAAGLVADISAADVTPASVTFNNADKNFMVTGSKGIAGAETTVMKEGTGRVALASVNTYGGLTTIDGGTLQLNGFTKAQVPVLSGAGVDLRGRARAGL